ncbi:hypothetical protein [Consotaella salsifontis]|uniref:Uncharacterized protein n=1 Tax=Consotaella salsifontis TaxID=1365950 RepID=A0A1T4T085_9HYPH|nr:hypothetical protein [Consotaella salsifontis]SKA33769.1 hypothetical protein SAMN05428963_11669 [Consotaella salsifontis]
MSKNIEFERRGVEDVVRVDGTVIGRITGGRGRRKMLWRSAHLVDDDKVADFERRFAASDQSTSAAAEELRRAGLV